MLLLVELVDLEVDFVVVVVDLELVRAVVVTEVVAGLDEVVLEAAVEVAVPGTHWSVTQIYELMWATCQKSIHTIVGVLRLAVGPRGTDPGRGKAITATLAIRWDSSGRDAPKMYGSNKDP